MGIDLTTEHGIELFQQKIVDYNVFINSSYIGPGIQEQLLNITRSSWSTGHVVTIGSVIEFLDPTIPDIDLEYMNSKLSLKTASLSLGCYNFKTTYVLVGGFKDLNNNNDYRMDPDHIVKIIKWAVSTDEFLVPVIGMIGPYNRAI
jgi:hypothetical protein